MFLMYFYQKQFSIYARDLLKFSKEKSKEKGGGGLRDVVNTIEKI